MDCKSFGPSPSVLNDMRAGQRSKDGDYSRRLRNLREVTMRALAVFATILAMSVSAQTAPKPRARDLGIPFDGLPGRFNAITDVAGVEVGHVTLISGNGKLESGKG